MNAELYLVLDQGGHSSRALVFDATGEVVAHAAVPVTSDQPYPGWVEQNPRELVNSLKQAAAQAVRQLDRKQAGRLVSAALVTQRSSLVCWHKTKGQALYPVISWQDRRAAQWLKQQQIDVAWVRRRTGLTPSPHYGASKIRWCLDHVDRTRQAHADGELVCGPLAGYLINQLTGGNRNLIDPANASRTLLWNIRTLNWDKELLNCFGIDEAILPNLAATEFDYGDLLVEKIRIPLKLVNGDQSAALFANGLPASHTAYINAGTGAFISIPLDEKSSSPDSLLKSLAHQGKELWMVAEGTVNGAASALDWARQELGLVDADLNNGMEQERNLPLFINGVAGLGSPFWSELASEFIGDGNTRQKLEAVLESILFLLRVNLLEMQQVRLAVRSLSLSGGLSRIDRFCQKLADLNAMPVLRPAQTEASARGAAFWLAGCPAGWTSPENRIFLPSLRGNEIISARFRHWHRELLTRLDPG